MDIGKSLTFVFDDKKWIEKLLIGGLITLAAMLFVWTIIVPFLAGFILMGYMIAVVRNVRAGSENPLPEWHDWGGMLADGFKLTIIFLIWSLPLIIVWMPGVVLMALAGNNNSDGFAATISLCLSCLSILYGLILFVASPAITIRYSESGEFGSGFEFSEILHFTRKYLAEIIVVVIVLWGVQIIASFVGLLLCGIGLIFTAFWATLVQGHLYGQIGLEPGTALAPASKPAAPVAPVTEESPMPAAEALPALSEESESAPESAEPDAGEQA
ncbi:MAG: DUF4013 domain-containing protein [Caldilineales bacterium]|nr:DUF4013 domain-containing protein [Caldilineales bacterium]